MIILIKSVFWNKQTNKNHMVSITFSTAEVSILPCIMWVHISLHEAARHSFSAILFIYFILFSYHLNQQYWDRSEGSRTQQDRSSGSSTLCASTGSRLRLMSEFRLLSGCFSDDTDEFSIPFVIIWHGSLKKNGIISPGNQTIFDFRTYIMISCFILLT